MPFPLQPSVGAAASEPVTLASKKLNRLIKKAGSVLETSLELLELVVERRVLHKLLNIMDNTSLSLAYWSDNRVSTVGGSLRCTVIRTVAGRHSCSR